MLLISILCKLTHSSDNSYFTRNTSQQDIHNLKNCRKAHSSDDSSRCAVTLSKQRDFWCSDRFVCKVSYYLLVGALLHATGDDNQLNEFFDALITRELLPRCETMSVLRALTYTSIHSTVENLEGKKRASKFLQSNKSLNGNEQFWTKPFVLFPCRLR